MPIVLLEHVIMCEYAKYVNVQMEGSIDSGNSFIMKASEILLNIGMLKE
jgi:hypothetical protein